MLGSQGKLCWTVLATTIYHLQVYNCRYIHGFRYRVYTTDFCPRSKNEWNERSAKLGCTKGNSYACFPNEQFTQLVEFCYPLPRISIPAGLCLFLSKTKLDLESYNCETFDYGCPDHPYAAATIFEYPSCVSIANGCFLADGSCKSISRKSTTSTKRMEQTTPSVKDNTSLTSVVLPTGILLIFGVVYILDKRKVCRRDRPETMHSSDNDTDTIPLINGEEEEEENISKVQSFPVSILKEKERNPLHFACQFGDMKAVEDLLNKGHDVNYFGNHKVSPLFMACQNEHNKVVNLLLKKGADVNLRNYDKNSPLQVACENGYVNTVQLLLEEGAKICLHESQRTSPLHIACQNGHDKIVQLLLNKGVDINLCTSDGTCPLHIACQNRQMSCVKVLLENSADVNFRRKEGITSLFLAIRFGPTSIVKLLLDKGADANLCRKDGSSVLHKACQFGHKKIVRLLLRNGANVNLRNKDGNTPYSIACKRGYDEIAELLRNNVNTAIARNPRVT